MANIAIQTVLESQAKELDAVLAPFLTAPVNFPAQTMESIDNSP
jgi:hypothetical protein